MNAKTFFWIRIFIVIAAIIIAFLIFTLGNTPLKI
jgi:hypothetical protein